MHEFGYLELNLCLAALGAGVGCLVGLVARVDGWLVFGRALLAVSGAMVAGNLVSLVTASFMAIMSVALVASYLVLTVAPVNDA